MAILELMASAALGKQKSKQNIILLNSILYNLFTDMLKAARVRNFSGGHPRRFGVTLTHLYAKFAFCFALLADKLSQLVL